MVAGIDLLPTAAALAGLALSGDAGATFAGTDGESLLPLLMYSRGSAAAAGKNEQSFTAKRTDGGSGGGGGGDYAKAGTRMEMPLQPPPELHRKALFWHMPMYLSGADCSVIFPVYNTSAVYWRNVPSGAGECNLPNFKTLHCSCGAPTKHCTAPSVV